MPLTNKWTRIVLQVDAYEKQTPNNSLSVLEHFLLYEVNQITLNKCYDIIRSTDEFAKTGDFFLQKRNEIRNSILNRCKVIAEGKASNSYQKLAAFFNENLADHFPFTQANDEGKREADEKDIGVLLTLFERIGPMDKEVLKQAYDPKAPQDTPPKFLRQIKKLKPYLNAAVNRETLNQIAPIKFDVNFRSDRSQETGGEKIVDWFVLVDGQRVGLYDEKRTGTWDFGEQVQVALKWAGDSHVLPAADPGQPQLQVNNCEAKFAYTGRWSFIRLLRHHAEALSKNPKATEMTLQFSVPTRSKVATETCPLKKAEGEEDEGERVKEEKEVPPQKTSKANVFLTMALSEIQVEEGKKGLKPLGYPIFPSKAPPL